MVYENVNEIAVSLEKSKSRFDETWPEKAVGATPSHVTWPNEAATVPGQLDAGITTPALLTEVNFSVLDIFYACMWYVFMCNILKVVGAQLYNLFISVYTCVILLYCCITLPFSFFAPVNNLEIQNHS